MLVLCVVWKCHRKVISKEITPSLKQYLKSYYEKMILVSTLIGFLIVPQQWGWPQSQTTWLSFRASPWCESSVHDKLLSHLPFLPPLVWENMWESPSLKLLLILLIKSSNVSHFLVCRRVFHLLIYNNSMYNRCVQRAQYLMLRAENINQMTV